MKLVVTTGQCAAPTTPHAHLCLPWTWRLTSKNVSTLSVHTPNTGEYAQRYYLKRLFFHLAPYFSHCVYRFQPFLLFVNHTLLCSLPWQLHIYWQPGHIWNSPGGLQIWGSEGVSAADWWQVSTFWVELFFDKPTLYTFLFKRRSVKLFKPLCY